MRILRARFTVRGLMIAIIVVAAALWVGLMMRRSANYRDISTQHALEAASLETSVGYPDPESVPHKRAHYHERLRDKYLRASRRPWIGVDEDPPIPN